MFDSQLTRRRFLQTAVATAGAVAVADAASGSGPGTDVRITDPVQGAVLHRQHGQVIDGGLKIRVRGTAPGDQQVQVEVAGSGGTCSVPAERQGDAFEAEVILRDHETDIVAKAADTASTTSAVRVLWDRNSRPRYRFAVDDNGFFLRDIWQQQYRSLFDCFYLAMYRDLHREYGAKFVLNIYYTTADEFDLTKFPDRYRSEWQDHADWLKLAFHAHANDPPQPYYDAPPEQVIADFVKIREQIYRFAGEQTYSPTTIVHWGVVRPSAWKPLAEQGVRVLSGYFQQQNDQWTVNYRLDPQRSEYLSRHDALKDFASGMVFSKIDMVCNTVPLERIVPLLEEVGRDPHQNEILDLMTHEQYFWPFYSHYLPDHPQRIEAAIRWATEHGYEPVFLHEGFLGLPA
jgi:hypothetical protein